MEKVKSMKFYCYKEFPVDYSNLSVEELDEKIKAEQERLKKIKNGKIFLKLKIMSFKSPLLRQRAFLMPEFHSVIQGHWETGCPIFMHKRRDAR